MRQPRRYVPGSSPGTRVRRWIPVLALLVGLGCGGGRAGDDRPLVVVSLPPQAELVRLLAGERIRVEALIPPGASAHTHEPTIDRMRVLEEADLYLRVGHPGLAFERSWLERLGTARPERRVVDLWTGPPGVTEDPHVWLVPAVAVGMAEVAAVALTELVPDHAEAIGENLERFRAKADTLDRVIRERLAPHQGKSFLVFHPAWGAFAGAYGIEQLSVEHEGKEPSPDTLARLIERCRAEAIRVIFIQPQEPRSAAEIVALEIGGRVEILDPLAPDWAASLEEAATRIAAAMP